MPKTVIRAGGGVFYDRLQGNPVFDMLPNPPSTAIPQFYYGNLASIPSAASGAFFPQSVNGFDKKRPDPDHLQLELHHPARTAVQHPARRRLCRVHRPATSCTATTRTRFRSEPPGCRRTRIHTTRIRSSTAPPANPAQLLPPVPRLQRHHRLRFRRQLELPLLAGFGQPPLRQGRDVRRGLHLVEVDGHHQRRLHHQHSVQHPQGRLLDAQHRPRASVGVQLRVQPAQVRQVDHGRSQGGRVDCERLAGLRHHLVPERRADIPEFLDRRHRQPERTLYRVAGCRARVLPSPVP